MPSTIQLSNLSPHFLHNGREIVLEDHDQGINHCACPFTKTCWVMFLAFPLDFQKKSTYLRQLDILDLWLPGPALVITNLESYFATLLWISKRFLGALLCVKGNICNNGFSWTVPVYVLDSKHNDVLLTDEDPIPPNGNRRHVLGTHGPQQQVPPHFEHVNDLNDIQQANIDRGCELLEQQGENNANNGNVAWDTSQSKRVNQ
jgi:hypothetical protein